MNQPPLNDGEAAEEPTTRDVRTPGIPEKLVVSRFVFLRLLGVCYFFAFHSFFLQAQGLYGQSGILPMAPFLGRISERYGWQVSLSLPSIFWFNAGDSALLWVGAVGMLASILLVLGVLPTLCLAVLWFLYLSIVNAGEIFMSYQWDILLIEIGFLAILLAPMQVISPVWCAKSSWLCREPKPSLGIIWLFRFLLFRLMFASGMVKLASGDPTWRGLTALTYHYQTQPLPTPLAWYAHQLPLWFQTFCCFATFFLEIAVPFAIFLPRKARLIACGLLIFLQLLIAATGNYCFFNLLTISLCVLLLDDDILRFPKVWRESLNRFEEPQKASTLSRVKRVALVAVTSFIFLLGTMHMIGARLELPENRSSALGSVLEFVGGLHLVNSYGLFAVMTTTRLEIVVEGSNDGENWLAYEFKYKPGSLRRAPPWVAPYQPRLDWQMWFAALSNLYGNPWFERFALKLLQGSPEVLKLLEKNPFPDAPPRYLRARVFDYNFTNFAEKDKTGDWWRKEYVSDYMPQVQLADFK